MARALRLASRGLYTTEPNPRVGCVIARDGNIIGEGFHARAGEAHAEVMALRQAGEAVRGSTVYVSMEPCAHHGRTPPCADALLAAGVSRVVAAMIDPNPLVAGRGLARLRAAGVEVHHGLMEAEALALNPGFVSRMSRGRPWVRVKMAASLDGRTAMASGESQWITGVAARHDVQLLRARSSALLTGMGTVRADDPRLNLRLDGQALGLDAPLNQPRRVILDPRGELEPQARLFTASDSEVLVFTLDQRAESLQARLAGVGARVLVVNPAMPGQAFVAESGDGPAGVNAAAAGMQLCLAEVLEELGRQHQVNELQVEAGPRLSGALLQAGLVDELVIYLAPHLMGSAARPLFDLPILSMAGRLALNIQDVRRVGEDWRLECRIAH